MVYRNVSEEDNKPKLYALIASNAVSFETLFARCAGVQFFVFHCSVESRFQ